MFPRAAKNRAVLIAVAAATTAASALPVFLGAPSANAASKPGVVGMGDSYGSGEGLYSYDANTNTNTNMCHRSLGSWQRQLADGSGHGVMNEQNSYYNYRQVACSGSTTHEIDSTLPEVMGEHSKTPRSGNDTIDQIKRLDVNVHYVFLSIGGNDLKFSTVMKTCLNPTASLDACLAQSNASRAAIPKLMSNVKTIVQRIHQKSPLAKIVIAGYPFVVGPDTGTCTTLAKQAASSLYGTMNTLNNQYAATVKGLHSAGYPVVFSSTAYAWNQYGGGKRHDACSSDPWLNGLKISPDHRGINPESFHPNKMGYTMYGYAAGNALATLVQ